MKNNYISSVTSKGQITIPGAIREKMHINNLSKIEFIMQDNCIIMIPINNSLSSLSGILPKPAKALSIEEMNAIIQQSGNN